MLVILIIIYAGGGMEKSIFNFGSYEERMAACRVIENIVNTQNKKSGITAYCYGEQEQ